MVDLRPNRSLAFAVGGRVRSLRLGRGLSAGVAASALGIDVESFEAAESGQRDFSADQIATMGELLNVKPSVFFEDFVEGLTEPFTEQDYPG